MAKKLEEPFPFLRVCLRGFRTRRNGTSRHRAMMAPSSWDSERLPHGLGMRERSGLGKPLRYAHFPRPAASQTASQVGLAIADDFGLLQRAVFGARSSRVLVANSVRGGAP
jgi:hypothetical protein